MGLTMRSQLAGRKLDTLGVDFCVERKTMNHNKRREYEQAPLGFHRGEKRRESLD